MMSNQSQPQQTPTKPTQVLRLKWGDAAIDAGWIGIPNMLIHHAADLKLDSLDVHIVLVICTHWWSPENKPFVSNGAVADAVGVDGNTVRRRIQQMERRGLMCRVPRYSRTYKNSNQFLFDGLIAALQPLALKAIHDRKIEQKVRTLRGRPKRPGRYKLKVVPDASS